MTPVSCSDDFNAKRKGGPKPPFSRIHWVGLLLTDETKAAEQQKQVLRGGHAVSVDVA